VLFRSGFGLYPDHHDPAVDAMDPAYLARSLAEMRANIADFVARTPDHAQFLTGLDPAASAAPASAA
jgi:tryptophan halogenase